MSELLFRLSKLSSRNEIRKSVRLFSTGPYLTLGTRVKKVLPDGCKIGDALLYDPVVEDLVIVTDKTIPKELIDEDMIGASHGWGFFSDRRDRTVRMCSDIFNPLASKSNPAVITLPRLTAMAPPITQTVQVRNVAMSSSSPQHEDCVVAIKFSGNQLSWCRPSRDLEWTNILTPPTCLENSNLMYSKRDQKFYLPGPGANYLFAYGLHSKGDYAELHELNYRDHPQLDQSEWELLSSCSRTEYFLESPSTDDRFIVKWYTQGFYSETLKGVYHKTKRFMVFREEETLEGRIMCYTEDIGDMCIFLSSNEAFCIPASSCQGLKPNSIYFMGRGFGCYNLATRDVYQYVTPKGAPNLLMSAYWLPPFLSSGGNSYWRDLFNRLFSF